MTGLLDAAVVAVYALVTFGIGSYFLRRGERSGTFLLGDRTLGTVGVFVATFSTFYGTGILVTFAAFGYRYGVGAVALPAAAVLGFAPLALAAPRIKSVSDRREAVTLPGLLEGVWSVPTRTLAALVTGGLFAATLAVNLLVAGRVLDTLLGVPLRVGILAFGALVVGYTTLGGFRGVLGTDAFQMVAIVTGVLFVVPTLAAVEMGAVALDGLPPGHLDLLAVPAPLFVVYLLVGAFTFFGSQDLFQRIFAARDGRSARRGLSLFAASLAVVGPVAVGLGVVARAAVPGVAADEALLALTGDVVPTGLVGVVLVGYLALANSDADSQLLTVTSTLVHDVLPRFDVDVGGRDRVWIDRLTVVGVGGLAVSIAAVVPDVVVLFGGVGTTFAALGMVVVATLYWEPTTDRAAFAGLAVGTLLPVVLVATAGASGVAPVLGVVATAGTVGVVSVLDRRTDLSTFHSSR